MLATPLIPRLGAGHERATSGDGMLESNNAIDPTRDMMAEDERWILRWSSPQSRL